MRCWKNTHYSHQSEKYAFLKLYKTLFTDPRWVLFTFLWNNSEIKSNYTQPKSSTTNSNQYKWFPARYDLCRRNTEKPATSLQ